MKDVLVEALVATGAARRDEPIDPASVVEGVTCVTMAVRLHSGWAWVERDLSGSSDSAEIDVRVALCRSALEPDQGLAVLPRVAPDGTLVFPGLPGGELFSDLILAGELSDQEAARLAGDIAQWTAAFHANGRRLSRRWPRVRLALPWLLDEVRSLCDRAGGRAALHAELEGVQELLLLDHPDLRARLAEAVAAFARRGRDATVVHGELTPGYSVCGEGAVRVIGFHRAAIGPAAYDVGCFLGELAEFERALREPGRGAARAAATAFVDAYAAAAGIGRAALVAAAAPYAALKVVAHLARYVRAFGFDRALVRGQLALAEELVAGRSAKWVEG